MLFKLNKKTDNVSIADNIFLYNSHLTSQYKMATLIQYHAPLCFEFKIVLCMSFCPHTFLFLYSTC